ncbi:MAG: hydroxyacylglutathione hydrolase [Rhodospirillales bacterium]|jgi:hydroxyacylglutathione hydrolase|nr:hydroxyacylglutathione hydrolase [Rhodospirillales bacterium]
MAALTIEQIPVLRDNYVYLVHDSASGLTAAVDPAVAEPVTAALAVRGWRLTHILNTHHHGDHTGGNLPLKAATGCTIVGHGADAHRIPGIDVAVGDGESFAFGRTAAQIIAVPGHTLGHIAYWFAEARAVFCGDTLFSLGCGRLFEGTAAMMWQSLGRLRQLPDETRVCCAHEYTQSNAAFALTIDPANPALRERAAAVAALRRQGLPTVPSRLGDEKAANPFLRADAPALAAVVGSDDPVAVFGEIRRRKDVF